MTPAQKPGNQGEACGVLPPDFEPRIAKGSSCDLPQGHGEEHETVTPDGTRWRWNAFDCCFPEDCQYNDDDCCMSFGAIT